MTSKFSDDLLGTKTEQILEETWWRLHRSWTETELTGITPYYNHKDSKWCLERECKEKWVRKGQRQKFWEWTWKCKKDTEGQCGAWVDTHHTEKYKSNLSTSDSELMSQHREPEHKSL